jgi:hypothetical protein
VPAATAAAAAPTTTSGEAPHHEHGAGSHEEVPTPAATATPSPTATRDLPRPELPDLGKTFTQDGASTFAGYYVRVLNYSRNSGDVTPLKAISSPDCTACSYDVEVIDKTRELGYSHIGLNTEFRGTWHKKWDPQAGVSEMDVIVDRAAHQVVDREGNVVTDVPELSEATFWLSLHWTGDRWEVSEAD